MFASTVLYVYFFEMMIDEPFDHDIYRIGDFSGYAQDMGFILMLVSIALIVRALMINSCLQRSVRLIQGSLAALELVALITLALFAVGAFFQVAYGEDWLESSGYNSMRLAFYPSLAAFVFLAALPMIASNALQKQ